MRFLSLLIALVLALALAWFSAQNWTPVTLALWPPYQLIIRLPVLLVICVLAGWLPTTMIHSFTRWRLTRRLSRTEAELRSTRTATPADEPFEMPVLKSQAAMARPAGSFVPPHIPTPPAEGL